MRDAITKRLNAEAAEVTRWGTFNQNKIVIPAKAGTQTRRIGKVRTSVGALSLRSTLLGSRLRGNDRSICLRNLFRASAPPCEGSSFNQNNIVISAQAGTQTRRIGKMRTSVGALSLRSTLLGSRLRGNDRSICLRNLFRASAPPREGRSFNQNNIVIPAQAGTQTRRIGKMRTSVGALSLRSTLPSSRLRGNDRSICSRNLFRACAPPREGSSFNQNKIVIPAQAGTQRLQSFEPMHGRSRALSRSTLPGSRLRGNDRFICEKDLLCDSASLRENISTGGG
jgi:hypothetical protein